MMESSTGAKTSWTFAADQCLPYCGESGSDLYDRQPRIDSYQDSIRCLRCGLYLMTALLTLPEANRDPFRDYSELSQCA